MVTFDWRRCPYPEQVPPSTVDYGSMAADMGAGESSFWPSQYTNTDESIVGSLGIGCQTDWLPWVLAGVLGWAAAGAGAFGAGIKKAVT